MVSDVFQGKINFKVIGDATAPEFFRVNLESGVITIKKDLREDYAPYYMVCSLADYAPYYMVCSLAAAVYYKNAVTLWKCSNIINVKALKQIIVIFLMQVLHYEFV